MWDEIRKMKPIERRPDGELFRLTPKQARRVWRLVKLCCNNVDGDCLLLDDGEGCVCPQSIAYTLICKYFRRAVLPAEPEAGRRHLQSERYAPMHNLWGTLHRRFGTLQILFRMCCRSASQTEGCLRPKKEVERRQLTLQKAIYFKGFQKPLQGWLNVFP